MSTLPVAPPPRIGDQKQPKTLIVGLVLAIFLGTVAAVASVIGASSSTAQQDDVLRNREVTEENQRILNSVCENARTLTEAFTTASPSPCPTVK